MEAWRSALHAVHLDEVVTVISTETGSSTSSSKLAQAPPPRLQVVAFRTIAREFPWEETHPGLLGGEVSV